MSGDSMPNPEDSVPQVQEQSTQSPAPDKQDRFTGAEWVILRDVLGHRITELSERKIEIPVARAVAEGLLADELIIIPALHARIPGYTAALAADREQSR